MRSTIKVSALLLALTVYHSPTNSMQPDKFIYVTPQKAAGANAEKNEIRQKLQAAQELGEPYASWAREALSLPMNTQKDARDALKYYNDKVNQYQNSPNMTQELTKKLADSESKLQQVTKELDELKMQPMPQPLGSSIDRETINKTVDIATNQKLLNVLREAVTALVELKNSGQTNEAVLQLEKQFEQQIGKIKEEIIKTRNSQNSKPSNNPPPMQLNKGSTTNTNTHIMTNTKNNTNNNSNNNTSSTTEATSTTNPPPMRSQKGSPSQTNTNNDTSSTTEATSTTNPPHSPQSSQTPTRGMRGGGQPQTPSDKARQVLRIKLKKAEEEYQNSLTNETKLIQAWHYYALIIEVLIDHVDCLDIVNGEAAKTSWDINIKSIQTTIETTKGTINSPTQKKEEKDEAVSKLNTFLENIYTSLTEGLNICKSSGEQFTSNAFGKLLGMKDKSTTTEKKPTNTPKGPTKKKLSSVDETIIKEVVEKEWEVIMDMIIHDHYLITLSKSDVTAEKNYANKCIKIIEDYFTNLREKKEKHTLNLKFTKLIEDTVKNQPDADIKILITPYLAWEICFNVKAELQKYVENERMRIANGLKVADNKIANPSGATDEAKERDKGRWQNYKDQLQADQLFIDKLLHDLNRDDFIINVLQEQFATDFNTLYHKDVKDYKV